MQYLFILVCTCISIFLYSVKNRKLQKYVCSFFCAKKGENTSVIDFGEQLFFEQLKNVQWYNPDCSYLSSRSDLVKFICETSVKFGLHRKTIYSAIFHFDRLCSKNEVTAEHLIFVAAVIILLTAKFLEREENIPSFHDLRSACAAEQYVQNMHTSTVGVCTVNQSCLNMNRHRIQYQPPPLYSDKSFKELECTLLRLLDWRLKCVLPIDFIEYFIFVGCVFDDDILDGHHNLDKNPHANHYIRKFAVFFLDILLQEYIYCSLRANVMASAILIASRKALRIQPTWNSKLCGLMQCEFDDEIQNCFNMLWKLSALLFCECLFALHALLFCHFFLFFVLLLRVYVFLCALF